LNVAAAGLCFHSFDPAHTGNTRFWFCDGKQRIEASGEIVWTDETHKGGLRFNALSPDAREQIRQWMNHPATPVSRNVGLPGLKVRVPLSGFSAGLAIGLMVSALVAMAFLLHIYRNQVGESLIQLGERFTVRAQPQPVAIAPAVPAALPAAPSGAMQPQLPAQPQAHPPAKSLAPGLSPMPRNQAGMPVSDSGLQTTVPAKSEVAASLVPAPPMVNDAGLKPRPVEPAPTVIPTPPVSTPMVAAAPDVRSIPAKLRDTPPIETVPGIQTGQSIANNAAAAAEMYFEVGRFKDKRQAAITTDKLTQLGFPNSAVQKSHLWASSYHVLVGPYGNPDEASAVHKNLLSYGFKPRPFERGSRYLTLRSELKLNGSPIPLGECEVSWESYVSDAAVKFMHDNSVVNNAAGRWVTRDTKYDTDAYVYRRNPDGTRTLLEIRFAGMRQALEFGPTVSQSSR